MTASVIAAASFCGIAACLHIISIVVAILRCRPRTGVVPLREAPPVTIVRPVCGLDNFVEETLRTSFELAYPAFELIFCVASGRDPVVPVVRKLIAAHPGVAAQLLVGDDRVSVNPKLNNCVKGWRAAAHPFVVIADSNVLMPKDYIQRLLAAGRLPAPRPLGQSRMRFPQQLPGARAVFRRYARHRLRPGQDHAVAARRPRSGRRHPRARR